MTETIQEKAKIIKTEEVVGGKSRIAGTRIRVVDIVGQYEEAGMSPKEIASQYGLDTKDVYAALIYYYEHPREIIRELLEQRSPKKEVTA